MHLSQLGIQPRQTNIQLGQGRQNGLLVQPLPPSLKLTMVHVQELTPRSVTRSFESRPETVFTLMYPNGADTLTHLTPVLFLRFLESE